MSRWPYDEISIALVVAGVALFWWNASRMRRLFVQGTEVRGRVTHFKRFADDPTWVDPAKRQPWQGVAGLIDRPSILRPSSYLRVVYPAEGGERAAQYMLDDEAVARLRPSVDMDVALIVHPELIDPLLRDAYLDP